MGAPRVAITNCDASKNISFFGIESGGKKRQRMFFLDNPDPLNGIGVEKRKPFFSWFYRPMEVVLSGTEKRERVWVDTTSFKKRQREFYQKLTSKSESVNIPFNKQSPEKHSDKTIALWNKLKEFTHNPPLLEELDRLAKYNIKLAVKGVKVARGDRGRVQIVSPEGDYFVCLTRSESQGDFAIKEGTRKKIKVAINRSTLGERIVATGKKVNDPDYLKEIQILEKLKGQEEFVQMDTWAETDDKYYIVMEKCVGNLWNKIGDVKEGQQLKLALDYARGVQKLHQRNIIHRDIKPQNFLIAQNGRGKICDFGEAADGNSSYGPGTPTFSWDPQMIKDQTPHSAADVWALGSTFYFLFHPKHYLLPYQTIEDNHTARRVMEKLTQEQIDWSIDKSGIGDSRVRTLLKGMLSIDRAKRLDAKQVVKRLEEIERRPAGQFHPLISNLWERAKGYFKVFSHWPSPPSFISSFFSTQIRQS